MNQKEKAEAIKRQLVIINKLLKKPENKFCADCKRSSPSWASINLGVFVCINCSGCHREIGVHVTKIKSVNLDVWPNEVLKNFQKINNKIANEYWEYKLKKFNFKAIQNDNYKLIQFIRDKYEYKKWVDKKRKDPMTLIIQGKFKNEEDEEENSDDEKEENDENSDNEKKKKKDYKSKTHRGRVSKMQQVENDEDEDEEEKNKNDNFEEIKEYNNIKNETNNNSNNNLYNNNYQSNFEYNQHIPQINNIFVINNNPNPNLLEGFGENKNNNNNLLDFNVEIPNDNKSQDLLCNIQNAYNNQNINESKNNNTNDFLQQTFFGMNKGMNNNINNMNNMNNMLFNLNTNSNSMNNMNNNMFSMNNNQNNNMNIFRMNNNNFGMNINNNQSNYNFGFNNKNFNNNQNVNNNLNLYNNSNTSKQNDMAKNYSNSITFNMEYLNKNLSIKTTREKKVDPFANLLSFKK